MRSKKAYRELKSKPRGTLYHQVSWSAPRKALRCRLTKLQDTDRKDDVVTFEELGVDRLYVDEAHSYKNLFLYTKMRNVAGLSTTGRTEVFGYAAQMQVYR